MKFPPPFSSSSCPLESLPLVSALGLPTPDFSPPHPSQLPLYPRCLLSPPIHFRAREGEQEDDSQKRREAEWALLFVPFSSPPPFLDLLCLTRVRTKWLNFVFPSDRRRTTRF